MLCHSRMRFLSGRWSREKRKGWRRDVVVVQCGSSSSSKRRRDGGKADVNESATLKGRLAKALAKGSISALAILLSYTGAGMDYSPLASSSSLSRFDPAGAGEAKALALAGLAAEEDAVVNIFQQCTPSVGKLLSETVLWFCWAFFFQTSIDTRFLVTGFQFTSQT